MKAICKKVDYFVRTIVINEIKPKTLLNANLINGLILYIFSLSFYATALLIATFMRCPVYVLNNKSVNLD